MASRGELLVLFFVLAIILFPSANVQLSDTEKKVLEQYNNHLNESLTSLLLNESVTYRSGYGDVPGFRLSYSDALKHRNASSYPFDDKDYSNFHESQEYSILPDSISLAADNIWYSDERQHSKDYKNYMLNITGYFKGSFANVTNLTQIDMPLPQYLQDYYQGLVNKTLGDHDNEDFLGEQVEKSFSDDEFFQDGKPNSLDATDVEFTDKEDLKAGNISHIDTGNISFDIEAYKNLFNTSYTSIVPLKVAMKFSDTEENELHTINMHGIYYPDTGNIFIATESAKFESQFTTPHLLLNEKNFKQFRGFLQLIKQSKEVSFKNSTFSDVETSLQDSKKCEYLGYLKFSSTNLTKSQLNMIDREINQPLGRPIAKIPDLSIEDGILYSPDCGISISMGKIQGSSRFQHMNRLRHVVILFIILLTLQIYLLIRQMNIHSVSASADSGVSYYTLAMINLVDGGVTMLLLISTAVISSLYITLAIGAMLCFLLASLFELKFIGNVLSAQANEVSFWSNAMRATLSNDAEVQNVTSNTERDLEAGPQPSPIEVSSPPEAAAATAEPPIATDVSPSSTLYSRYFFSLFLFSFFILNMSTWPTSLRSKAERILLCILNSYMYPQVVRCFVRGVRCSLTWEFMIGTSIIRFIPILYMFADKNNVFHHHSDYKFVTFLFFWKLIPLVLLLVEENFDLRTFIPKSWLPEVFSYHPSINVGELKKGLGYSGMVTTSKNSNGETLIKANCAICMNDISIPIRSNKIHSNDSLEDCNRFGENSHLLPSNSPTAASSSDNGDYGIVDEDSRNIIAQGFMVTPCKHIFHDECLQGWMRYKLQCPICRTPLPPI